ncbi:M50 family metallopeptidase [Sphingomonas baiyangensis]|uniref:Site-2 protease family protein n=1 Tax=Sphingomonas baiyangensis TaxID=2572576 RepID=A0A4U1L3R4_9SPHN|nr:M50 family metallopeptidase [Sphingomonas baiyangensis]TKD50766.1 site-2 protease family protein [Sphingomonas baiyangensis]
MIESPGLIFTVIAFLLVLGPLVFVHELGHYLAGRWFGVHAEAFSVGFGREIAGFTDRRGTRWQFGWLPLGGYVRFAGDMNPASQPSVEWLALPTSERERTFQSKPLWQRTIIVAAGPAINLALAVLILAGFALAYGESRTPPVIGQVVAGTPAAAAGLQAGDRVRTIGGNAVETFDDIAAYTHIRPGERTTIAFERAGQPREAELQIGLRRERDRFGNEYRIGLVGVTAGDPVREPVSLLRAPLVGIERTGDIIGMMVETLGQIVTGRRSIDELGGPLRIAQVSGQQLSLGLAQFVGLVALVSINLGFINLLPVPMLDGGHLMFYAIEAVRRRPADPRLVEWAYRGGLAAVLALMFFVTINDLGAFGVWRGLAGLIG